MFLKPYIGKGGVMKKSVVFFVAISLAVIGCASPTSMSNVERLEARQRAAKNRTNEQIIQSNLKFNECVQRAGAEAQDRIGWNPFANIFALRRQQKENEECEKKYLH